jgi:hypothetical protein
MQCDGGGRRRGRPIATDGIAWTRDGLSNDITAVVEYFPLIRKSRVQRFAFEQSIRPQIPAVPIEQDERCDDCAGSAGYRGAICAALCSELPDRGPLDTRASDKWA